MKSAIIVLIFTFNLGFLYSATFEELESANSGIIIDNLPEEHTVEHRYLVENDTLKQSNSITKIWSSIDDYNVEVQLVETGSQIRISVFNMLGKEVFEIFNGTQSSKTDVYQFNSSALPKGIYFCILIGPGFRDAEKFIVLR